MRLSNMKVDSIKDEVVCNVIHGQGSGLEQPGESTSTVLVILLSLLIRYIHEDATRVGVHGTAV